MECNRHRTTIDPIIRLLPLMFPRSPKLRARTRSFILISFLLLLVILVCLDVRGLRKFTIYYTSSFVPTYFLDFDDIPPSYAEFRRSEDKLPQHDLDLPCPEGRTGRYVLFTSSKVEMTGWNNKLAAILMDSVLAYKSKRSYVFYDFAWPDKHYSWPIHKYREWTPHTPLGALISGPSAGASWGAGDPAPRSISERWFDVVCPKSERRYINTHDIKPNIYWEEGSIIFDHWVKILSDIEERCVEIVPPSPEQDGYPQVFDLYLWGSSRSLSLWDEFVNSPVSRLLTASPIVASAIEDNLRLFVPVTRSEDALLSLKHEERPPFDHTMSVHIRRGDYTRKCRDFWKWSSTFYSWNLLPFLPDRFDPPPGFTWGKNTPENLPLFLERCLPDIPAIIQRINDVRDDHYLHSGIKNAEHSERLNVLYIMTNDRTSWLDDLKRVLKSEGWETVLTLSDMVLSAEQRDAGVAVDMEIGKRSAVFLGNGWSSFTSNVVHQRLASGKNNSTIRFL